MKTVGEPLKISRLRVMEIGRMEVLFAPFHSNEHTPSEDLVHISLQIKQGLPDGSP